MDLIEIFLVGTSALLLGLAVVGTGIYFAAVREGYRAYRHVTLAFVFVLAVSITGTFGLLNDPPGLQLTRAVFNLIGVAAMADVIGRFSHPSVGDARQAAVRDQKLEEMEEIEAMADAREQEQTATKEPEGWIAPRSDR